jgi:hypothetical protein
MSDDSFDKQTEYEAIQLGFILGAVGLVCPPCLRYYAGRYCGVPDGAVVRLGAATRDGSELVVSKLSD